MRLWLRNLLERFKPRHKLRIVIEDTLPVHIAPRELVVAHEDGENWVAGLHCPCGCGDRIELVLLAGIRPRWDVGTDRLGRPFLHPSVWRRGGCGSHFWLRKGRIRWC